MSNVRTKRKSRADEISQQVFGRPVGQIAPGGEPIKVAPDFRLALARAALPHYWYPQRAGVEHPPDDIRLRLSAIHPDLALTRPPTRAPVKVRSWLLWTRKPAVTYDLCPGWWLLLDWKIYGKALPLDERLFAAIYHFDARNFKSAVDYFDQVIAARDREKAIKEKDYKAGLHATTKEYRDSLKISSAGRGNRFALHHDGTVMPSRAEVGWHLEHRRTTLPSAILKEEKEQLEKARS